MNATTVEVGRCASEHVLKAWLPPEWAGERSRAVAQVCQCGGVSMQDLLELLRPEVCGGVEIPAMRRRGVAVDLAALWYRLEAEAWYATFLQLRLAGFSAQDAYALAHGEAACA